MQLRIGIDFGSKNIRAALIGRSGESSIPASTPNSFKILREDAEVFTGDFVDSCVIAVSPGMSEQKRSEVEKYARESGFNEIYIITSHKAVLFDFEKKTPSLVVNFGSNVEVSFSDGFDIAESEMLSDVGGDEFDKIFAEWLSRRSGAIRTGQFFLPEAEKIKIALSSYESYEWNFAITREEFERLIRFHVRRVAHVVGSMYERRKPEKLVAVGAGFKIPLVREMLEKEVGKFVICSNGRVARGAARFSIEQKRSYDFYDIESKIKNINKKLSPGQSESLFNLLSYARKYQSMEMSEIIHTALDNLSKELEK